MLSFFETVSINWKKPSQPVVDNSATTNGSSSDASVKTELVHSLPTMKKDFRVQ